MLDAILFDLDNTLIDRDAAMRRWVAQLVRAEGGAGRAATARVATVMRRDASGDGDRAAFDRWLAQRFACFDTQAERATAAVQQGLPASLRPEPGVHALLSRLRRRYRLGLVSNGGAQTQRAKLSRAGLAQLFDIIVISADAGDAKPAPGIFWRALRALGARPERALFVGDHPINDVAGATRVGLRTCWIARGRRYPWDQPPPTWSLAHVTALPQVLPW